MRRSTAGSRPTTRRLRATRALLVLALGLSTFGGQALVAAPPAQAVAKDSFDPNRPQVFVGQGDPTTLFAGQQGVGTLVLDNLGFQNTLQFNAMGYNTNDNLLYAIQKGDAAGNRLVQIGRKTKAVSTAPDAMIAEVLGSVVGLPAITNPNDSYMQGTFGGEITNNNFLYVRSYAADSRLWEVNVVPNDNGQYTAERIDLKSPVPGVADIVWSGHAIWGVSSTRIYRINPDERDVASWAIPAAGPLAALRGKTFGAAWTLGNGNLQLSDNASGNLYQIAIEDPNGDSPTFSLVGTTRGTSSSNNDGASSPGAPVDLEIVKTGPAEYAPGDAVRYTMTVTNHGPGQSSGSIVTDRIPDELVDPATTTPGCTISAVERELSCGLSALAAGASTEIVVTAAVKTSLVAPLPNIVNTAQVLGNEADPNLNNNSSTTTAVPHPGRLVLAKTSNPASGTTIVPGQLVQYTLTFTNAGLTPVDVNHVDLLQDVVDDAELDGAIVSHAALTAASQPLNQPTSALHITGELNGGVTATVTYSVRVKTVLPSHATGKLGNFLMALGEEPPPVCAPGSTHCTEHPVRVSLSWNKVNDHTPAQFLAGSAWTLTPFDRAAVPMLDPSRAMSVVDCVAASAAECTGPDSNPAVGKFTVRDLTIGKYRLTESQAPAGYLRISPIDIEVYSELDYGNIVNRQAPVPTLPLTGGMGAAVFWGSTGGLGLLAVVALILQRRKMRLAGRAQQDA
ncbi:MULTISPECIES: SpaA isopeptide-forming pilin-related protein [unclassified Leucobacter]|uniref:DUF6923 family protein n=1 Tax=unclassified Leucobacter TaxID=2621730 RepID=UPI00165E7CA0|nr:MULTISPECIES: SpaA isopeptide-forming pilin-related protein [unclassified Leucobacter]MBC9937408.1 DUF11 domain-containing protein [Leucobacter sp. cx-87]